MAPQAQGRCSASQATTVAATLLVLLFLGFHSTEATSTFSVGDTSGWTYNIQSWTNGKQFKAGDTLIFNYDASIHNVAVVDGNSYKSCRDSPTSKSFSSGKDQIKLSKGRNYFICSIPGHCEAGLKLAVDAS
ncbi:hypothetical protein AB3S75_026463 [Citrus x aurantiifolia]